MLNLCDKIKIKIKYLPPKDAKLCYKYLENRDFESILEIAKSVIIMKERDDAKEIHQDKWENIDIEEVQKLVSYTQEYLSYMDISITSDDYYDDEEFV